MLKSKTSYEKLYKVWQAMKHRCACPTCSQYKDYGARGIFVCEEWKHDYQSFKTWAFSNGYVEGLSLDRIDNDKGYYPENCRWTTRLVQQNNTRKNRPITINGETHNLREWSRIIGISNAAFLKRLKKHLSDAELIMPANERYITTKRNKEGEI